MLKIFFSKKQYLFISLFFIFSALNAQIPIAYYDFEDNASRNTTVETAIQEQISTIGTPTFTTSGLTAAHDIGNAITYGSSNTGYAIGYYGFTTAVTSLSTHPSITLGPYDCSGFSTMTLTFDCKGIGTKMPNNVDVYYSLNGTTYTRIVATNTVSSSYQTKTFTIPAAANNATTLYLRVIGFGAGASPTSTDGVLMIDNFTLNSSLITATTSLIDANLHGTGLASGDVYLPPYKSVTVNGAGITVSTNSNLILNGRLTLTAGVFDIGNNTLTFRNGTIATPIARTTGTLTVGTGANIVFGPSQFSATTTLPNTLFTTSPANFAGFKVDIGGTNVLNLSNNPIVLNNDLDITSGIFAPNNASGTISINGNLVLNSSTITNTANVTVSGNVTGSGTQTITSAGKIIMNGSSKTLSNAITYDNVEINSAGDISLTGSTVFTGIVTLTAGNLVVGASNTLTLRAIANAIVKTAGFISFDATSNFVLGNGADNTSVVIPSSSFSAPTTINNLTVSRGTGTVTWGNNPINVGGDLTINSPLVINNASGTVSVAGNVNINSSTLTVSVAGATLNINGNLNFSSGTIATSNATAVINVTGNITGTGLQSLTSVGKIVINGATSTLSNTVTYDNVEINSSGIVSLTGNTTFTGLLTLTAGEILFGANTVTFESAGNITKGSGFATLNAATSLVFASGSAPASTTMAANVFNGSSTIASLEIRRAELGITARTITWGANPLTISGNLTIVSGSANTTFVVSTSGNLTVNGNLVFTSTTGTSILTTTGNLTVNGDVNVSSGIALHNGAGKIIMTGKGTTANLAAMQYSNVELNSSNNFALNGATTITGTLTLTLGSLDVASNTLTFHTGNTPISRTSGTINLGTTSSLAFGTTGFLAGNAFVIPNNTFTSATEFANLSINRTNALTLNNQNFALSGILLIQNGRLILPANYIFTLRSTSITNTAMVGAMGATSNIQYGTNAAFRVERYIPQSAANSGKGVRAYRDISSSVNSGTGKIFDNWQEAGTNGLVGSVYYGTHITGIAGASPGGVDATTGLDKTTSGAKSLYTYDVSTITGDATWSSGATSTNATNDTLSAFKGYRITIRGDRRVDLYVSPSPANSMNAPATLRSTGRLVTGDVVFTTTGVTANGATNTNIRLNSASATGYTMIGNPYAAMVDWDALYTDASTANISSTYTLFDPNVGTTGGYATYNQTTGITVPGGSAMSKYIQPGQAFFIQNTSTTPTITFKETHKSTNTANLNNTFRTQNVYSKMFIDLIKTVSGRGNLIMDGVAVAYDAAFSNNIGEEDAENFDNGADNITILNPIKNLGIEGRSSISINDTIKLFISQLTAGANYQLKINTTELISNGFKPILVDGFTNTETAINLLDITNVSFTTTANPLSYNGRFYIVFRLNNVLPLTFINFSAKVVNTSAQLTWNVSEKDISKYIVEKSENNIDYNSIATIMAKGNNNYATQQYEFLDTKLFNKNYYRIKTIATDGKVSYSNIIFLKQNEKKNSISIYPKPITNNQVNIAFENVLADNYQVKIFNQLSQLVFETTVKTKSTQEVHNINLPSLSKGNYMIQIVGTNYQSLEKIIIQ